ncbi:hypothetical protein GOODEAATRI_033732, partial [Goodea atripinnis]
MGGGAGDREKASTSTESRKKQDQQVEPDDGVKPSTAQGDTAASNPEEKIEELRDLVKSLIRSQAARDQQMEKDASHQEQKWKSMQHQFQQIHLQVHEMQQDPRGEQRESGARRPQDDTDSGEGISQPTNP